MMQEVMAGNLLKMVHNELYYKNYNYVLFCSNT